MSFEVYILHRCVHIMGMHPYQVYAIVRFLILFFFLFWSSFSSFFSFEIFLFSFSYSAELIFLPFAPIPRYFFILFRVLLS